MVGELLAECRRLKALVTSRATLHLYSEQEFPVPPLALPDPKRLTTIEKDLASSTTEFAAIELFYQRARAAKVPIVAVDTPTAVDLTSGDPSDPVVQADLTVTFHRPKRGLITKRGAALAGKVLVAPIGIPLEADRG